MTGTPIPVRLETLLAHREWVRRVARVLTDDDNLADDLEQEVWIEALQRPPRVRGSIRGWLAATLHHNLIDRRRSDAARVRREEAVSRGETDRSADDLVADADALRHVVNAVMGLAEPYRSTVLLRYYEHLGPAEIAARQRVPVETVRTRLKRAIHHLRARLDAESGGDRSAWCAALLPLVRTAHPGAAASCSVGPVAGGIIVKTSTKAAIALAALLLFGGIAWWADRDVSGRSNSPTMESTAAPSAGTEKQAAAPARRPSRDRAAPTSHAEPDGTAAVNGAASMAAASAGKPVPAPEGFQEGPTASGEVVGRAIRLPDRSPVEGATVRLLWGGPFADAGGPGEHTARTGSNGVFRIGGLAAGDYQFETTWEGHGAREFRAKVPAAGGVDGIEVLFNTGGGVEGRVLTAAGPAVGVKVIVNRSSRGGGEGLLSAKTDATGGYRIDDLAAGDYGVELQIGALSRRREVAVTDGRIARADFLGGAYLAGTVTVDGAPSAGIYVRANRTQQGSPMCQATTDKDGRYRIEDLEPGEHQVTVQVCGPGGSSFATMVREMTLEPGENRLDLPIGEGDLAGEIAGRILVGATKEGFSTNATLWSLVEKSPGEWKFGSYTSMVSADANGEFRFRALRPGRYRITVGSTRVDVSLAAGERKTGVEVALPDPIARKPSASEATLTGTVKYTDGGALAQAVVKASDPDDPTHRFRRARADENGQYKVERLEPGSWVVSVQPPGDNAAVVEVETVTLIAGENHLDIRLAPEDVGAEISGKVLVRSSGKPLGAEEVELRLVAIEPVGFEGRPLRAFPDAHGAFAFRGLLGWTYRLVARPKTGGLAQREMDVSVVAGQKLQGVELALDDARTGKVTFVLRDETGAAVQHVVIESARDGRREPGLLESDSATGTYESWFEVGTHTVTFRAPSFVFVSTGSGKSRTLDRVAETSVEVREGVATRVEVVLRLQK